MTPEESSVDKSLDDQQQCLLNMNRYVASSYIVTVAYDITE